MAQKRVSPGNRRGAGEFAKRGLQAYEQWDIDQAIEHSQAAVEAASDEPEYLLNLAQALARGGDFDQALRALAEFMRLEPDSLLEERLEQLFASGMDGVETLFTDKMTATGVSIEEIGAAIQMWLEYRIALGRKPLVMRKPATWAAAVDYTVRKVNLRPTKRQDIATLYGISERALQDRHDDLVALLDVMPCDYRYFAGKENPLDKLIEAANLLEQLEARFQEP